MKAKPIWWMLPAAVVPYVVVVAAYTVFFDSAIMDRLFAGNGWWLLLVLALLVLAVLAFSLAGACVALVKRWDARSLAKAVMIVKLIQTPAYIIIFAVGALGFIAPIFLFPVLLFSAAFDACFIAMTGGFGIVCAINAKREGLCSTAMAVWTAILSCVYCVDVVAAIVLVCKLKPSSNIREEPIDEQPYE